jgi:molybdopterin-containing oxidoreductase family molybdopterin binding subunit
VVATREDTTTRQGAEHEDVWIHSACDMCFAACGIIAHRRDGVVVKIEGDPDCPASGGRLCAKGQASLIGLYDPSRVTKPLRRTNPDKGIGVDPGWEEISWDEALDLLTEKLRAVREDDPRKLVISTFDGTALNTWLRPAWGLAFGTPNFNWHGYFCGQYLHAAMYLTNGSFHSDFDIDHCTYAILLGNQHGFGAGLNATHMAGRMAKARRRGMRVVVVDPIGTNAAGKADEWVPIRPGTDGALILSMLDVLLNERQVFDAGFIARRTNGGYLVADDGSYIEDESGAPLVWDSRTGGAVRFDTDGADPAIVGQFVVDGRPCRPAFELLRDRVRAYAPEVAERITTIPAATIRRIATEFGEAARIGSTITVDGRQLPYRPVAVNIYRGAGAHRHGTQTALAVQTLNLVVGAFYVPGGHRGMNVVGPGGKWQPGSNEDGLITPPKEVGHGAEFYHFEDRVPDDLGLSQLFPLTTNRAALYQINVADPEQFGLPYEPEVLIVCRRNLMMNNVNPEQSAAMLRRIPYIVSFAIHLDETAEFADLVIPEIHSLERFDLFPNSPILSIAQSTGYYYWGLRQPVAEPQNPYWIEVLLEIADRLGFLGDVYRLINQKWGLVDPYRLDPTGHYSLAEMYDRRAKSQFGPERGLDWFREHGYHKVTRTVDENYVGPLINARFPLYFENMPRAKEAVTSVATALGHPDWETSDYTALPDWRPCPSFASPGQPEDGSPPFDLFVVNFKVPFQSLSHTTQNPWLTDMSVRNPYAYKVLVNTVTARRAGVTDGEPVRVESEAGAVTGIAKVTECIHPEVIGIGGVFGSWARGKPIARRRGAHFNTLLPLSTDRIDRVSSGVDSCVRVRISPARGA